MWGMPLRDLQRPNGKKFLAARRIPVYINRLEVGEIVRSARLSERFGMSRRHLTMLFAVLLLLAASGPVCGMPFNEFDKLTASDAAAGDIFGHAVSISGGIAVIGAWGNDDHGSTSGSAYVFDVTTGSELFKLTASDAAWGDDFGSSVAVSGTTAVIGAYGDDDGGFNSGAAYVFDVTTGSELFKLTASDTAAADNFGESVAISGTTAVIGSYRDDDGGADSGSAYVFDVTTGSELFKLTASDAAAGDYFGRSVSISGNTAVIGATFNDGGGSNSGAAYVFDVTTGGELFKLTASDSALGDHFGTSVAVSGTTAVIGSRFDDDDGSNSGSAYVFDVTTGGELFKLTASDAAAVDYFGEAVAVSGMTAVIGAYGNDDDGADSGSAYVFDVTTGSELFKRTASDGTAADYFGISVAVSGDTAIIGAKYDDGGGSNSGSAYVLTDAAGPSPPDGDINGDGVVDVADLGLIGGQWGTAGTGPFSADIAPAPNGDGTVDVADLGFVGAHWGETSTPSSLNAGGGSVPAPSAGVAAIGLTCVLGWTRRRGVLAA